MSSKTIHKWWFCIYHMTQFWLFPLIQSTQVQRHLGVIVMARCRVLPSFSLFLRCQSAEFRSKLQKTHKQSVIGIGEMQFSWWPFHGKISILNKIARSKWLASIQTKYSSCLWLCDDSYYFCLAKVICQKSNHCKICIFKMRIII